MRRQFKDFAGNYWAIENNCDPHEKFVKKNTEMESLNLWLLQILGM
jgi:hypothetical protein